MGKVFKATWSRALVIVSTLATTILLAVFFLPQFLHFPENGVHRLLVFLPVLILPSAALFIIRDYAIKPNVLAIRRLLWTTRLPLSGLQSAKAEPDAMRWSLRLWGNGGLFSITGWYRNRALGTYRAFVTDAKNCVVLRFPAKTIVVSPADPEQFVSEISQFAFRTS